MFAFGLLLVLALTKVISSEVEVTDSARNDYGKKQDSDHSVAVQGLTKIDYSPKTELTRPEVHIRLKVPHKEARRNIQIHKAKKYIVQQAQEIGMQQTAATASYRKSDGLETLNDGFAKKIKRRSWCLVNPRFRNGVLSCRTFKNKKQCKITCRDGFNILGVKQQKFECYKRENYWRPKMGVCLHDFNGNRNIANYFGPGTTPVKPKKKLSSGIWKLTRSTKPGDE